MLIAAKRLIARLTGGAFFPTHHIRLRRGNVRSWLGPVGERLAARALRRKGYRVLERGWRWRRFEVDLIAGKGGVVAFVEVKTRTGDSFGAPQEAVPHWKRSHIAAAAQAYALRNKLLDRLLRFDVVAVTLPPGGRPEVLHIENAFTV